MFRHITEDQVGRDWRHLIKPRLAELTLHIIFLCKPEPAMGLHASLRRRPGRIGAEHLGEVCFFAGVFTGLVQSDRLSQHQLGRAHVGIGFGDRELHALVLADGTGEHSSV